MTAALARGLGAYLRATKDNELSGQLRLLKKLGQKNLLRRGDQVLRTLQDDSGLRAQVLQWLDEGQPALGRDDAYTLAIACKQDAGWLEALRSKSAATSRPPSGDRTPPSDGARNDAKLLKARDEARREREKTRAVTAELEAERARSAELARAVAGLEQELAQARKAVAAIEREHERSALGHERELRRARRDVERAAAAQAAARAELKSTTSAMRAVERALAQEKHRATAASHGAAAAPSGGRKAPARREPNRKRKPLPVPKGRLEDDPETLRAWLATPRVQLVVDGYNVTKSVRGWPDLPLDAQRKNVKQGVAKLASRHQTAAIIVFDGATVPPGVARRTRGPVHVEYSKPPEIADDHIVERLAELPPDPVVVVTNDRELQERARAHGATIATSDQLVSLIRAS